MKKIRLNNNYLRVSLYALFVIVSAIAIEKVLGNFNVVKNSFQDAVKFISGILSPFIIGFCIAYLLNPSVSFFENKLLFRFEWFKKNRKTARFCSVSFTYLIFFGSIFWIIAYIVPEIALSIYRLVVSLPVIVPDLEAKVDSFINGLNLEISGGFSISDFLNETFFSIFDPIVSGINSATVQKLLDYVTQSSVMVLSQTMSVFYGLLNILLGLVIAFYMLFEKESFYNSIKKSIFALTPFRFADRLYSVFSEANNIFKNFIVGKALDSFIIGILCFIGLSIIKPQYVLLLSVIVGVTNMIPYFGPFIGAIPAVLITLFYSPITALYVAIFIFALQQFDGIILGPKILGESIGIPAIFVILAILLGGSLFGVPGMFLGVPLIALIKMLFTRFVDRQYEMKYPVTPVNKTTDD